MIYKIDVQDEVSIDHYKCCQLHLQALEGSPKKMTYYFSKDAQPVMVQKDSVLPELGGATIRMKINFESR